MPSNPVSLDSTPSRSQVSLQLTNTATNSFSLRDTDAPTVSTASGLTPKASSSVVLSDISDSKKETSEALNSLLKRAKDVKGNFSMNELKKAAKADLDKLKAETPEDRLADLESALKEIDKRLESIPALGDDAETTIDKIRNHWNRFLDDLPLTLFLTLMASGMACMLRWAILISRNPPAHEDIELQRRGSTSSAGS